MDVFNKPEALLFEGNLAVNFATFLRDFNSYLIASEKSKKADAVKIAIFLNLIGSEARNKFYSWDIQPTTGTTELSFDQVEQAFKDFCNPKKNTIYERIKFYQIKQGSNSFDDFLTDLRNVALGCEFANDSNMIRDFIIMGINNKQLKEKLMTRPTLTLDECITECRIAELDKARAMEVRNGEEPKLEVKVELDAVVSAEDLWRGVTSVSNAGKKRGRGKGAGKKVAKDLNRGQSIGFGKKNVLWPGLNSPIIRGKELLQQQNLPEDADREKNIIKLRDSMGSFRVMKLSPVDRGWSGSKMPGRSIGPPDPVGDEKFEGFDTRVLENKIVFIMKGNMGRKRRYSVVTVTGNGKGLAGFAMAKAPEVRTALRKSKNRAGQKLMSIKLCDNHTVFHDFYCAFGKTKIFVSQKPEGYGLVCHRAIQTICKVIGIKDIYAKIEGSTNLQHIVKAFFIGLLQQKTHQEIAEEKKLHIVEISKESGALPRVVASPSFCRVAEDIKRDEIMDFKQYVLGNKIVLKRNRFPPFYANTRGYELYLKKQEIFRNQDKVRLDMLVHEGELRSFLTNKYPECRPFKHSASDESDAP